METNFDPNELFLKSKRQDIALSVLNGLLSHYDVNALHFFCYNNNNISAYEDYFKKYIKVSFRMADLFLEELNKEK